MLYVIFLRDLHALMKTRLKYTLVGLLIAVDVMLLLNFMPWTDKGRVAPLDPPNGAAGYWTYITRQGWPHVARLSYRVGFKEYVAWRRPALEKDIAWGSAIVILGGAGGWGVAHFVAPRLRRWRRGFCRACGYDLTGNVSGICPECGKIMRPGAHHRFL